ncbi:hypothetical protein EOA32_00905 [Mesorhizobium sp. M1A.F.Ca.ET.072.01.1.1]|uniref:hypothetical protein n=1 Tax=Mesorhizobium sp. M1A.F.Ca.ET.072.01.1.1 TaxID=2496753 RepID=UPI000FD3382D|nr:hypothetical protein [Mesorhizobium sp. M1A.F.Ca.ET.072.01.1.1]RUW55610.1 hypothetical protein EOA32_00905 [Mesorhizobium sp. M1A.F.Ca.ET.072.01.1.1]
MLIAHIEGCTRVCGKSQGYLGLPVRDETIIDKASGEVVNLMHTAWEPTPDEIEKIKNGAKIIVSVIGNNPQPIMLNVG